MVCQAGVTPTVVFHAGGHTVPPLTSELREKVTMHLDLHRRRMLATGGTELPAVVAIGSQPALHCRLSPSKFSMSDSNVFREGCAAGTRNGGTAIYTE